MLVYPEKFQHPPPTASPMMRTAKHNIFFLMCTLVSQAGPALMLSQDGATVYDAVNGINWLADANLAATNRFGLPVCTASGAQPCVNASGLMNYAAAAAWVQAMNAANYLGHNNWQLPTTPPLDRGCGKTGPNGNSVGFGCTASALGSLFYTTSTVRSRPRTASAQRRPDSARWWQSAAARQGV